MFSKYDELLSEGWLTHLRESNRVWLQQLATYGLLSQELRRFKQNGVKTTDLYCSRLDRRSRLVLLASSGTTGSHHLISTNAHDSIGRTRKSVVSPVSMLWSTLKHLAAYWEACLRARALIIKLTAHTAFTNNCFVVESYSAGRKM